MTVAGTGIWRGHGPVRWRPGKLNERCVSVACRLACGVRTVRQARPSRPDRRRPSNVGRRRLRPRLVGRIRGESRRCLKACRGAKEGRRRAVNHTFAETLCGLLRERLGWMCAARRTFAVAKVHHAHDPQLWFVRETGLSTVPPILPLGQTRPYSEVGRIAR